MMSMERVWNALALVAVIVAILVTGGVISLGDLPSWSDLRPGSESPERTEPAVTVTAPPVVEEEPQTAPPPPAETAVVIPPQAPTVSAPEVPEAEPDTPAAPSLQVSLTSPSGPNPRLRAHDEIKAMLLTPTDVYAYCYYADGKGAISRIFPNRFRPDPLVRSGALELPDSSGAFTLVADTPNRTEELLCMAATTDLGPSLPAVLQGEDLTPLSVRSLDEISALFRSLGADVAEARLVAQVDP